MMQVATDAATGKSNSPHDASVGKNGGTSSVSDNGSSNSALSPCCTIGIDFGRTKCEAAVVGENDSAELIPLELVSSTNCFSLPSYVSMEVGGSAEWEVGQRAVIRAKAGHPFTVYDLTVLLGRKVDDLNPEDVSRWAFAVRSGLAGKALVESSTNSTSPDLVYPEQIAAKLFSTIKQRAQAFTGKRVSNAVVCVPAAFNRTQRQAVRDACSIAGLQVDRLVISSSASAVANAASFADSACSGSTASVSEKTVLVADCGGGSLDVSLVRIRAYRGEDAAANSTGVEVQVKATVGDLNVGGEALIDCLVKRFAHEAEEANTSPTSANPAFSRQLRRACTLAVKILSASQNACIALPPWRDSTSSIETFPGFTSSISRPEFENTCGTKVWSEVLDPIERTLEQAKMSKGDIDSILLLGGAMAVPKIRALLADCFARQQDRITNLPEHTAAVGAALIADWSETRLLLHEPTPLGLGIRSANGDTLVLVPPSTGVPTRQSRLYYASCQSDVTFDVLEDLIGPDQEINPREVCSHGRSEHCLGRVTVDGSRASSLMILKLEIVFEVEADDHLVISVADRANDRTTVIQLAGDETCLSAEDITLAKAQFSQERDKSTKTPEAISLIPSLNVPITTHDLGKEHKDPLDTLRSYLAALKPMIQANRLSVCITPGDMSILSCRVAHASAWLDQVDQSQQGGQRTIKQERSAREHLQQIRSLHLSSVANSAFGQLRQQLGSSI